MKYIRIIGHIVNDYHVTRFLHAVGIVISSEDKEDGNGRMFSIKIGTVEHLFHEWNIEYITKKEYFKGVLMHGDNIR